jgi:hypothetical protein
LDCPLNWRGNGKCNEECMSLECNWYGTLLISLAAINVLSH